jgi:16S rRNA (cytosine1402-N4)-methyltransferase
MSDLEHRPVMLDQAVDLLAVRDGGLYLDCTLGGGGHAREVVRRAGSTGRLIGLDRDASALARAAETLKEVSGQVALIHSDYQYLDDVLTKLGIHGVDGILFDLGVSTWQVLDPERGFSFNHDAPLDMRMDQRAAITAADLVNNLDERELASLIQRYGEERWARRIASFIAAARARQSVTTTGQLVEIIKAAIPAAVRRDGPHPARRTFQALRIAVNDELAGLERGLESGIRMLVPGGRIVVISFHSLEDRIVKNTFKNWAMPQSRLPRPLAQVPGGWAPTDSAELRILTKRPLGPEAAEVEQNPRARSAKLRAAEKLAGTPRNTETASI